MSRHFGWAMLAAAGLVFGAAMFSHQPAPAVSAAPRDIADADDEANLADQLKDIKREVKAINALLRSGTLKVVVVINP
jgi:hypothetical protein